jgi:hypothetical protein
MGEINRWFFSQQIYQGCEVMNTICKLCGSLKKDEEEICEECRRNDREDYCKIKEFLLVNPHTNILQIVQATGADIFNINRFIDEGRFVTSNKD